MQISQAIEMKREQWANEAELTFARFGKQGIPMHRELWANGQVMVGWEGARANQYIPLEKAVAIFRAGWNAY